MKTSKATLLLAGLLLLVATCAAQSDPASKRAAASAKAKPVTPAGASQKVDDMLDSFIMMEQGFWKAWKARDIKPFEQHLAPNFVNIDTSGLADKAGVLKGMGGCDVKNYNLSDFKLTKVDADAALLTYKASNVDATCGGQKAPQNVLASSLFKKTGGTWTALFHQETEMPVTSAKK
jgi:hypothetical protein